jgi:DUF4097 and DUF4098 domain-containing protein YvlB
MRKITGVFIVALCAVAPVWAQTTVDEVRPFDGSGTVSISNIAGSVEVLGGANNQVEITGTLGENVKELAIDGSSRHLDIEVKPIHGANGKISSYLTIRVPSGVSIEIDVVSADVTVGGISGNVEIEAVSGEIEIGGRPETVDIVAVSGDIELAFAPAETEIESVSGRITIRDGVGAIELSNVSGKIEILGGTFDEANVESVSGSIFWDADIGGSGPFDMENMSGTIKLVVSSAVSADFEISTFSGNISNAFGQEPTRTSKYAPGKELSFTTGSGGPRVSISSFSGSVKLETR